MTNQDDGFFVLIISIALIGLLIFILRMLGAWMFRIDEVIHNQRETIKLLYRIYKNQEK